jgi:hypothetical protein
MTARAITRTSKVKHLHLKLSHGELLGIKPEK